MKNTLTTGGTIRLVIYVLSALIGLAALILPIVGFPSLGALLGTVSGAAAAITGGTATYNLPKAPDQGHGVDVAAILPAILAIVEGVKGYVPDGPAGEPVEAPAGPVATVEVPEAAPNTTLERLRDMLANKA